MEGLIAENPDLGKRLPTFPDVRELVIAGTPFSFIYRLRPDRVEILRLWDNRANPENLGRDPHLNR